jgi:hypothetical protein
MPVRSLLNVLPEQKPKSCHGNRCNKPLNYDAGSNIWYKSDRHRPTNHQSTTASQLEFSAKCEASLSKTATL